MKIIFDYNQTLFDPDSRSLYPGVLDMLADLTQTHELFLVSRNGPERRAQLSRLGIETYFRSISFVDEKTPELFTHISKNENPAIVIGDSMRDEITIGNMLGLITVRIKQGKFASETPTHPIQIATHEISDIRNIKSIIAHYE